MISVKGTVDITKTITELPECGVEGCNNQGWIALGDKFVCGECLLRWQKMKNEQLWENLKKNK